MELLCTFNLLCSQVFARHDFAGVERREQVWANRLIHAHRAQHDPDFFVHFLSPKKVAWEISGLDAFALPKKLFDT